MLGIRDLCHLFFDPVEAVSTLVNRALTVAHGNILEARGKKQLHDRDRRRARAGGDDLHVLFFLTDDFERIRQTCQRNNRRAVLVVVENRNVALFLELALDLKAPGRGNVLEVDAAEAAGDQVNGVYKLVDVVRLHAKRERIHVAERLKEHALAFHDRHACLGSDVAETENRRAVGDDRAEVPAAR